MTWTPYDVVNPRDFGGEAVAALTSQGVSAPLQLGSRVLRFERADNAATAAELVSYFSPTAIASSIDDRGRGIVSYIGRAGGGRINLPALQSRGDEVAGIDTRLRSLHQGDLTWHNDGSTEPRAIEARESKRLFVRPETFPADALGQLSWTSPDDPDVRMSARLQLTDSAVEVGQSPWNAFLGARALASFNAKPIGILQAENGSFWIAPLTTISNPPGLPRGQGSNMIAEQRNHALQAIFLGDQLYDFSGGAGMLRADAH
jgi:hypothetical protein